MARVHYVQKARKDNKVVKKGEPYYWWKTRITSGNRYISQMHYSATKPKPSQLTQSEFLSRVLAAQERLEYMTPDSDGVYTITDVISELEDILSETEDKLNNMPEGLQQGDAGMLLQARIDALTDTISELQGIDIEVDETGFMADAEANAEEGLGDLDDLQNDAEMEIENAYQQIIDDALNVQFPSE